PRQRSHRPHAGIEIESLTQFDVDRAKPLADWRCARPFERDAMLANKIERRIGQGIAEPIGGVEAGGRDNPVDLCAGGRDDSLSRISHLWTNAIAWDEDELHVYIVGERR